MDSGADLRSPVVAPPKCTLLVVDDEPYILPTLQALLSSDFHVLTADSADSAQALFARHPIHLILTDQKMPRRTGVQLLEWVRDNYKDTVRLLMTGFAELDDAVDAINRGHVYHYLLKPWRTEELIQVLRNAAEKYNLERNRDELLEELRRVNHELEQRVADRTRALEEANRQLQERSRELEAANQELKKHTNELKILVLTDPLTGLFNRRAMDDLVRFEVKRHARYPSPLSLGIVDADHFKQINTDHTLPGGDEVLKGLARILTNSVREVDSVGRIGGEEFLVIARETNFEGATVLAERIRSTVVNSPVRYRDKDIPLTVSVGIAVAEVGVPTDYEGLLLAAAEALNHAKRLGRNRCEVRRVEARGREPGSG
jgi:diguanylate cyclase (GGDEF)-like protein